MPIKQDYDFEVTIEDMTYSSVRLSISEGNPQKLTISNKNGHILSDPNQDIRISRTEDRGNSATLRIGDNGTVTSFTEQGKGINLPDNLQKAINSQVKKNAPATAQTKTTKLEKVKSLANIIAKGMIAPFKVVKTAVKKIHTKVKGKNKGPTR